MSSRTLQSPIREKLKLEEPIYGDKHALGSILKIKLKNFMAFDKITVCPGPGTNLILGTNGSGKSSIIAAIGICFGASPAMINNSSKLSNFIRAGCETAKIRIILKADPLITILCTLEKSATKPTWRYRQKKQTFKELSPVDLQKLMETLKIHVDNICMYLPQERVKEFAALKPKELLDTTLTIISPDLAAEKLKIQKSMDDVSKKRETLADLEENYNRYKTIVEQKSNDVSRLDKKEKTEQQIQEVEFRIKMVNAEETQIQYHALKKTLRENQVVIQDLENTKKDLCKQLETCKTNLQIVSDYKTVAEREFKNMQSKVIDYQNYFTNMTGKKREAANKLRVSQEMLAQKSENMKQISDNIKKIQDEAIPEEEKRLLAERAKELKEKLHSYKTALTEKKQLIEEEMKVIKECNNEISNIKSKLSQLKNQKNQIIDKIIEKHHREDIKTLCDFISQNKTHFKGEVYGPAISEINFPDPYYAKYFFDAVDPNFQFAFICEHPDDQDELMAFCKQYKLSQITLVRVTEDKRPPFNRSPEFARLGFNHWLSEVYDAPDLVKNFFNVFGWLDRIPCSDQEISCEPQDLFHLGVRRYFIQGYVYRIYSSRYHQGAISTFIKAVKPSYLWTGVNSSSAINSQLLRANIEKCEERKQIAENQKKDLDRELNTLNDECGKIQSELQSIVSRLNTARNSKEKLKKAQETIERLQNELEDIMEKPRMYKDKLKKLNDALADQLMKLYEVLRQMKDQIFHIDKRTAELEKLEAQKDDLERRYRESVLKYQQANNQYTNDCQKYMQLKEIIKELRQERKVSFTQEQRENINNLPSDLEQLLSMRSELKTRLSAIQSIRPEIRQEYEDAKKKLDAADTEKSTLVGKIEILAAKNLENQQIWQRSANDILKPLGATFKKMMTECGFNGNVRLSAEREKMDMSFQIDLMVSFKKDTEMTALSSTRQSGGEKSVATLLYLLALQSCTPFPFRVIDEINQGMDEENEVATFTHAMNCAMGQGNDTQYFLVSPKLHENLHIPEEVTVLLVLSGPWIQEKLDKPVLLRRYSEKE